MRFWGRNMKKLVIIGANDFQNRLILKAKEMGFETHVFAWAAGDVGERTADHFYPVSIVEKEQILEECRKIRPDGVCSIASDLATVTVNYVSEALGLNSNAYEVTLRCTNKYEMRKAMKAAGVGTPGFVKVGPGAAAEAVLAAGLEYPVIVKPTDRSGSRGITKVYRAEELPDAVAAAVENSFEKRAVIEEYLEGDEYSCECISFHGEHHFLAFTKKFTTGAPHFIETGHREPSDIPEELQPGILEEIFRALDALGITDSASHAEFKLGPDGRCRIIEIGARMGGDCIGSDLVPLSTGYDFVRMVIDVACGQAPSFEKICEPRTAEIRFAFTAEDLKELEELKRTRPESIVRISEMEEENLGKTVDSSTRAGYWITAE